MNQGKYVFSQLSEFLPQRVFDGIVQKYEGDKYVRHFSCWNQLLCMLFGQLTGRDSLRDLLTKVDRSEDLEVLLEKVLQNSTELKKMSDELGVPGDKS